MILRTLGLFSLGRYLNRRALVILCYHGVSIRDEHKYLSGLFVSQKTFSRRMRYLRRHHKVVGLDEGLKTIHQRKVVITFDDGFYNFLASAVPLLRKHRYPATVYLSTYYVENQVPVPNLAAGYMIKKQLIERNYSNNKANCSIKNGTALLDDFNERNRNMNGQEKNNELKRLAHRLDVSYEEFAEKRLFHLLNPKEVGILASEGFDFQLHTHRHRNVVDNHEKIADELKENKARIGEMTGKVPCHFAYPSGRWDHAAWPELTRIGVVSAATMDQGLNRAGMDSLCLRRIYDSENIQQVEFEWAVSGLKDIILSVFQKLRGIPSKRS